MAIFWTTKFFGTIAIIVASRAPATLVQRFTGPRASGKGYGLVILKHTYLTSYSYVSTNAIVLNKRRSTKVYSWHTLSRTYGDIQVKGIARQCYWSTLTELRPGFAHLVPLTTPFALQHVHFCATVCMPCWSR